MSGVIKMNKHIVSGCLLFLFLSTKILADCSPYVGRATLNEIVKEGGNNGGALLEIQVAISVIPETTYDNWIIRACSDGNATPCSDISVADLDDSLKWLWADESIINKDYFDFKDGFDLAILDENGQFIDYIQVGGYSGQNFTDSCSYNGADSLDYVYPIPNEITNGTKILLRSPDGIGEWFESKNLNEYPPTPGDNNDGTPPSAALIADYHFDECVYTGTDFEIIDETGTYPASIFGGLTTTDLGQVERAAELNDPNHHIETSIPLPSSFSVSTWFKKPTDTSGNRYFVLGAMSAGGDLLYIDRNNSWRWGVYSLSPAGATNGSYSFNALDDNWHHMVLLSDGGQTKLYIDGQLKDTINRAPTGTLKYIGTSFDGVSGTNAQSFRAPLDEFMVFDGVLTDTEITDIYNNQNAENNYDGSARIPADCDGVVHYKMDEISWSGGAGEVIDSESGLNGHSFNGANTSSLNSAIPGTPGTCGYGVFDGVNDYIEIADNSLLDLEKELTITVWINIDSIPSSGLKSIMSKDENYEFHVNSSGQIYWWWQTHSFSTSNFSVTPGQWHHIAVTYRSGRQVIYVDGVEEESRSYTGNLVLNNDPLQIGSDQGYGGRYFNGDIDELRIYKYELTAAQIVDVYNATRPCAVTFDHFEIDTIDEQGITCQADNIIIKACADSLCSTLSTNTFDVDLYVNGNLNRSIVVNGGSVATNYSYTTVGNAALSLDQTYECTNSATTPCNVTFKDSGFVFSEIPIQLSGKSSDVGFNERDLTLQAIETDTGTGECIGAFPDGGDVEVNLSYTCDAGSTCVDELAFSNNGNSYDLTSGLVEHTLRFSTDSTANFDLIYPHAAKFILNAQTDVEVINDAGDIVLKDFSASSNSFVEKPFGIKLDFSNDGNGVNAFAADASSIPHFKEAGETFSMTSTAMQWVDGQDNDKNGIPDNFTLFNSNSLVAENFSNETLVLAETLMLPDPDVNGTNGVFTVENPNSDFSASVVNGSYNYSEVGIIQLDANLLDNDYLGAGPILGQVTNVGRFIPANFELEISSDGTLSATCKITDAAQSFVYSGQMRVNEIPEAGMLRYGELPSFVLTAKNVNGTITQNYTGAFIKLVPASVVDMDITQDGTTEGKDGATLLNLTESMSDAVLTERLNSDDRGEGIIDIAYSIEDHFVYTHEANAEVSPFPADINIAIISIIDSDLVTANDSDGDDLNLFILTLEPTPLEVRFGRLHIAESYGPETSDLMQTLTTQYLSIENKYITNIDDNCTAFIKDEMELSNNTIDPNDHYGVPETGLMVNGVTTALVLNATNLQGLVDVVYLTPLEWLKHDWDKSDTDETPVQDPSAVATFGRFRGNDRIIYWREK